MYIIYIYILLGTKIEKTRAVDPLVDSFQWLAQHRSSSLFRPGISSGRGYREDIYRMIYRLYVSVYRTTHCVHTDTLYVGIHTIYHPFLMGVTA